MAAKLLVGQWACKQGEDLRVGRVEVHLLGVVHGPRSPRQQQPLNGIFDERYVVYWRVLERPAQPDAV